VVLVEDEAHLDAAGLRRADRVRDEVPDRSGKAHVVERELERGTRGVDERDDPGCDVLRLLTAVGQLVQLEVLD
jgi:hypothetical protein